MPDLSFLGNMWSSSHLPLPLPHVLTHIHFLARGGDWALRWSKMSSTAAGGSVHALRNPSTSLEGRVPRSRPISDVWYVS